MTESEGRFAVSLMGRYTIERELGRGGMATVFLAHDERHHRLVALKVLRAELTNAIGSERFTQEIRIVAGLHHPHILAVFDSGEAEGVLYYVMPFVSGETLRQRLERERQLPIEDALCIAEESADALAYAHERGIIHRDIKPENILLSDGHASVADFGIARVMQGAADDRLTSAGMIIGTPAYMSPEQATGEREVDGRSDVYSLGCVLYEMLAGAPPFRGHNAQAVVMQHVTADARPVREVRPSVSPAVEAILIRAMAKVPADRFTSAREMWNALRHPDGGPTRASIHVVSTAPGGPSPERRRRSRIMAAGSLLALTVVGGAAVYGARHALRPPLSPSTFALSTLGAPQSPSSTARNAVTRLQEALREWTGAKTVPLDGKPPATIALALGAARDQRAGRLVVMEAEPAGDSVDVLARVYDTAGDTALRDVRVRTHFPIATNDLRIAALAAAVVRENAAGPPEDVGTRSVTAVNAYDRGRGSLALWDLDSAEHDLRRATVAQPDFAKANLWLAQTLAWQKKAPIVELRAAASRAASLATKLGAHDSISALALDALADARYPDACTSYGELIRRDPADVIGLLGKAQCNELDSLVVADKSSPSGFAFRSSWYAAAT
ncbi:MAG: serine/threonine protein kinase, partial [Gemmatimonadota bacterium]|nr:serine/threonine protein kinase [Gemmatimonadota bacterium]